MTTRQLIMLVFLQLFAVLSVGWYLLLERERHVSSVYLELPSASTLPATPASPPYDKEENDKTAVQDVYNEKPIELPSDDDTTLQLQ